MGEVRMESRIYHVLRREDDSWQVLREGFRRPHIIRDSKAEAVRMAKRFAKVSAGGRIVVHNPDNAVEREFVVRLFWE
jgi:hypothetical protein